MDQAAAFYRIGLLESIILFLLVLLAFGALTILARERWLRLGLAESLIARLAAAIVLASIAVGGLSGVLLNLLQGVAFSDQTLTVAASRNQAILGVGLALALAIVGIIRVEMYHRGLGGAPSPEEDADWKVEPPEAIGRR
jgi:hypothetical protein